MSLTVPRHLVLDMDGTLYLGARLFPGTPRLFDLASRAGIGLTLLTNNCSRSRASYLVKLAGLGLSVTEEQIRTSAQAMLDHLAAEHPAARRVYLLGTGDLAAEFTAAGLTVVTEEEEPDLVVVAFDQELTYARLCRAAWWVRRGKPFLATHPDNFCPTDQPTVLVDCGAITAALERATGRRATVLGKPHPAMLTGLLARHGLGPGEVHLVGDRLATDLALARAVGCGAVLVLTGETQRADLPGATIQPDLVCEDIGAYADWLQAARAARSR